MAQGSDETLRHTSLYDRHVALGGRMVGFGGYALPVQYEGIVAEHLHTRASASLFDVSHMGQIVVTGPDHAQTVKALETITPADLASLAPGDMRYTVLLNEKGGIEDDLIITRPAQGEAAPGAMTIVVNAARKSHDLSYMSRALEGAVRFDLREDLALLALQGPLAADVLRKFTALPDELGFMQSRRTDIEGIEAVVTRSGYTGEDGFEISLPATHAQTVFDMLIADERVRPAGLGARDSLRLEAGLCLYGHDMDDATDPVSAGLLFAIGKERRSRGGFIGAETVLDVIAEGPDTKRIGIVFEGRQPVREGTPLIDAGGAQIGKVTSGTFAPTAQASIAMGYLPADRAAPGTNVTALVRGREIAGTVSKMPFVPQRYVRKSR